MWSLFQLYKWSPMAFSNEDNNKIAKIHLFIVEMKKKIISRTTGPIRDSSSDVKPSLFPTGDDNEITKIHWPNIKIFSRTTGSISTKPVAKHPRVKETLVFKSKIHIHFSKRRVWVFSLSLNQRIGIIIALRKCVYRLELFLRWTIWSMDLFLIFFYNDFLKTYSERQTCRSMKTASVYTDCPLNRQVTSLSMQADLSLVDLLNGWPCITGRPSKRLADRFK